jgi:hypothetical protein
MKSILAKLVLFWLVLPATLLAATPSISLKRSEIYDVVEKAVIPEPVNREVMFISLLFTHLNKQVVFDNDALESIVEEIEDIKPSRWERKFGADFKYRGWVIESLRDMIVFNKTKWEDISNLAQKMTDASLEMNAALEHMNRRQLLFLIQFTSQQSLSTRLAEKPRKITVGQLLHVLRAEQNNRVSGRS